MTDRARQTALGLLFCSSAFAQPAYQECDKIGVITKHPAGGASVTGWNTYTGTGLRDGQWNLVDIRTNSNLGTIAGIKAVFISGILIITNPDREAAADMHVAFRAPGQNGFTCADYSGQSTLTGYGGNREPIGLWVPVVNNLIEVCWTRATVGGQLGANTYYGAALAVNAYCK